MIVVKLLKTQKLFHLNPTLKMIPDILFWIRLCHGNQNHAHLEWSIVMLRSDV